MNCFSLNENCLLSNSENEQKKTWPLAQFVSVGLTKLDSTCLEEPFEKNCVKWKSFSVFPSLCLHREQNSFGLLDKISRKDVKISLYVSTKQFEENFVWNFAKFSISFNQWAKLSLNKTGQRRRKDLSETFLNTKDILRRPFWRFGISADSINKAYGRHHDLSLEVCCPTVTKVFLYGTFCRYMPLFGKDCTCVH